MNSAHEECGVKLCNKIEFVAINIDFMRSRIMAEYMEEDRHLWRFGKDCCT